MTLFEQLKKDKKKPFDIIKISIKTNTGFKWQEYLKISIKTNTGFKWQEYFVLNIPDNLLFLECIKIHGKYQVNLEPVYSDIS